MPPTIVFYISGHGFGHAVRQIEVINAISARRPDVRVVIRSNAAPWLFELTLDPLVEVQALECDTGAAQLDSLHVDEAATIRRAAAFYADLEGKATREATVLRGLRAVLVVADIPPLAFEAAAIAGVPAIALANFTWDWIYEGYPEHLAAAPDLVSRIRRAYSTASLALRLPMWGGFASLRAVSRDIPFVARHARREPTEVRAAIAAPPDRPLVLASFGSYGVTRFDWTGLRELTGYSVVMSDTGRMASPLPGVIALDEQALYASGLRYEDLVAAADVVVTKPGYAVIAEALANNTALLYTSRGHFVEYDVLVAEMPRFLRCRFIGHDDFLSGRWQTALDRLLAQPPPPDHPRTDGARVAAEIILGRIGEDRQR